MTKYLDSKEPLDHLDRSIIGESNDIMIALEKYPVEARANILGMCLTGIIYHEFDPQSRLKILSSLFKCMQDCLIKWGEGDEK